MTDSGVSSFAISAISGIVAWIAALIKAARLGRAGWVIGIVFTGIFGSLAYGLAGLPDKAP